MDSLEDIMGITVDDFKKWDVKMDLKIRARNGSSLQVLILPTAWCVARFVND